MIIHLSFIRDVWISATLSASVTLPFTYPHIQALLTSNSLFSMMIASLASVIQLSLTYPHVPDEAQMNNHQASYLVNTRLIFIFYRRFVDDIINRRKKNIPDELYFKLNNYHRNIKLTIEISPVKFLDTQLVNLNGKIERKVYRKLNKLPVSWSSNIPKRYKRNAINGDLHRAKRIATDFDQEIV